MPPLPCGLRKSWPAGGNALYVFPDDDPDWCVIMPLNMPTRDKKAVKRHGRLDGVATAYRWKRTEKEKSVTNGELQKILQTP